MLRFPSYVLFLSITSEFIVNASPLVHRAVLSRRGYTQNVTTTNQRCLKTSDIGRRNGSSTISTPTTKKCPGRRRRSKDGPFTMAYYPSWVSLDPEAVDFTLYDWIDYAFAIPTADFGLEWSDPGDEEKLKKIVEKAHKGETKVKISLGGWEGSQHFSAAVATDESRKKFADNLKKLCESTGADGIDLDWEFPGRKGAGNPFSKDDLANLLKFTKTLRNTFGTKLTITSAVDHQTWFDDKGEPTKDLKEFGELFDWVTFMAYNFNVPRKDQEPGVNAPLSNGCKNSTRPEGNIVSEMQRYIDAGIPKNKIAIGFAGYGYLYKSDNDKLRNRDAATKLTSEGGKEYGAIQFTDIVKGGALNDKWEGAGGFTRHWDKCSSTPFLKGDGQLVSYDDPESLKLKGKLVKDEEMWGMAMWDIHGDTKEGALIKAAIEGMGRKTDKKKKRARRSR